MFLVEIAPLRRVPGSIQVLTYSCEDEQAQDLRKGSLVKIPFRKSTCLGLVLSLHAAKQMPPNIKPIDTIVSAPALLPENTVDTLIQVADFYKVSYGEVIKKALPPIQVRKLAKKEFAPLHPQTPKLPKIWTFHLYATKQEHADFFQGNIKGKTLILIPELHLQKAVFESLSEEQQKKVILYDTNMSDKSRFENWFSLVSSDECIVIGTRNSVFLPLGDFETIIIDFEHDDNHKHWDQAPRFHVKDVLRLRMKEITGNIHLASFSPSLESYKDLYEGELSYEKKLAKTDMLLEPTGHKMSIIDMKEERRGRNFGIFSEAVQKLMHDEKKNLLFFLNRKGFATSVGCNTCGYVFTCDQCSLPYLFTAKPAQMSCSYCMIRQPMQSHCPSCSGLTVELRGAGTEQVENLLRSARASEDVQILRVDGNLDESEKFSPEKANWAIGTSRAFSTLDLQLFDAIILVDIDKLLQIPEYNATANAWHTLNALNFFSSPNCQIFIQTHHPDHLTLKSLSEPDRFYRTELMHRKQLLYPPYMGLTRFFYGNKDAPKAEEVATQTYESLKKALTQAKKAVMLHPPIEMQPKFFRGMYFYCIIVKIHADSWYADSQWLSKILPVGWKVDPRPNSLLSP